VAGAAGSDAASQAAGERFMKEEKRMLELFSGTGRMANEFKRRGWKTLTVDLHQSADMQVDVMKLTRKQIVDALGGEPDFIHASPPCTAFSVASIGRHWTGGFRAYLPKTQTAKEGIRLVNRTKQIITWFPNARFTIENPRGVLRKLPMLAKIPRATITFCQYGEHRMKPTDIWYDLEDWMPRKMCKNGMSCHDAAPRGAKTGTQGLKSAYERGALPLDFCREIAYEVEKMVRGSGDD
jgi:hypothetical protein